MRLFLNANRVAILSGITVILTLSSPTIAEQNNYKTSFDCDKAASEIEKMICGVKDLADTDVEMGILYKRLLNNFSGIRLNKLKQEQLNWIKQRNTECSNSKTIMDCLKDSFSARIAVLKEWESVISVRDTGVDPIDKQVELCRREHVGSAEARMCIHRARELWDKKIAIVYGELMIKLNPSERTQLVVSQQQWVKYRDEEFKFADAFYSSLGGTMWLDIIASDKLQITKERALQLRGYLFALEF